MFGLFKRESPAAVQREEIYQNVVASQQEKQAATNRSTIEVVQEIHRSFFTASERALKEAEEILKTSAEPNDLIVQVGKLGFSSMPVVQKEQSKENERKAVIERAKIIKYFAQTYPTVKYISEQQVQEICAKYNLVFTTVNRYVGEMPEKNMKELLAFHNNNPIKTEDKQHVIMVHSFSFDSPFSMPMPSMREIEIQDYPLYSGDGIHSPYSPTVNENYMICAPQSDVNMFGAELNKNRRVVEIPDPIVLFPVRQGYVVVTAWGDEAQDVVNEKNN